MTEHWLPLSMAAVLLAGVLSGYPVALVMMGTAVLFWAVAGLPDGFLTLLVSRVYANVLSNWLLVCIPMFIFMGLVLERSRIAERSLVTAQRLLARVPGGLALAVLAIGGLMAAISGIIGASVVLLALLALPEMQRARYADDLSAGMVAASGTLAILIPPSIMLIVLADQLRVPIGSLFAGAFGPAGVLVGLYALYVILRARLNPADAPPVAATDPADRSLIRALILDLAPLLLLIAGVLGSIIAGIATPTEASGLGALGALLIAFWRGGLTPTAAWEACRGTARTSGMVILVMIGATLFAAVFHAVGGKTMIEQALAVLPGGAWGILAAVMLSVFLLGFVLDWLEIVLILMPIFGPVLAGLDFGNGLAGTDLMIWIGILVAVNLQTSFLTPPFGFALFYLRGAAGDRLSNLTIYRGVAPLIGLQVLTLLILMAIPQLAVR